MAPTTNNRRLSSPTPTIFSVIPSPGTILASNSLSIGDLPSVRFSSVRRLAKAIEETYDKTEDILYVTGITKAQFVKYEAYRDRIGRKYRFFHLPHEHLLIITLTIVKHEQLHHEMDSLIRFCMVKMNDLRMRWRYTGAATFYEEGEGGSSREGDSGRRPVPERRGEDWPTLVVNSGVSQSLANLRSSIKWWFAASRHAIKIVLIVKLYRNLHQIVIEKWTEGSKSRHGATTTRALSAPKPIRRQTITISMTPEAAAALSGDPLRGNIDSYVIHGGELHLEFELLFLRPPNPPVERDIIIDHKELQQFGAQVWY